MSMTCISAPGGDEFGSDSYWADWIGGNVLEREADDLWPWLTTRPT